MSQAQIDQATQKLYEDMTIREDLTDDESQVLLDWAEVQIKRLAAQEMDDSTFDDAFSALSKTLSRMGRLAAERDNMQAEDVEAGLQKIEETAAKVGLKAAENMFLAQSATGDVQGNVEALITYLSSGTAEQDTPETTGSALILAPVPTQDKPSDTGDNPAEPPVDNPPEAPENDAPLASFFNRLTSQIEEYLDGEEKPE